VNFGLSYTVTAMVKAKSMTNMKWIYKWVWIDADPNNSIFAREERDLNQYGAEGWELISVVSVGKDVAAVMKKAL
jgi:hypothetical protein